MEKGKSRGDLNQFIKEGYEKLVPNDSPNYLIESGEYYSQQMAALNPYYSAPVPSYSYDYTDTFFPQVVAPVSDSSLENDFWQPQMKKDFQQVTSAASWNEIFQTESGYNECQFAYSDQTGSLMIDTSFAKGAPYHKSHSSPAFKDDHEKTTPHKRSHHSSPSSKGQQKRNVVPPDGFIYQVQFKRAHRNFILAPSAPRDLLPGDFVKVEADRGEDMGIVLTKCPVETFEEVIPTAGYRGRGFSSGQGERKYLFRRATPEERAALNIKVRDEEKALEYIQEKVAERGLPMQILDAEYQFDRHKLTFFFEADRRIDFRDLVDTSTISPHDAGIELAKATGFLPDREGNVSARSSFATSVEEPLSTVASTADYNDFDQLPILETFRKVRKNSKSNTEDYHFQSSSSAAFNFTQSWYSTN